jgi:hypothetical protein
MVSYKLKQVLPTGALRYVLKQEGGDCSSSAKIAYNADIIVSYYDDKGAYLGAHTSLTCHCIAAVKFELSQVLQVVQP